jgi:hypothetical protein
MAVGAIHDIRQGELVLRLRPGWLALSGAVVLATYCVLIWAWLYLVAGLSRQRVRFLDGARIWFVSNLGNLLPGRIWGIIQMSAMSTEAGISPAAAAAASIINAAVNIATGMAVGVIAGTPILIASYGENARWTWLVAAAAVVGVVALPVIIPWAFRVARRFGAKVPEQTMPPRLIAVSAGANVLAWGLYGVAFLCLTRGIVDLASRSLTQHIAVNATSYVIGYLAIPVPAGIGVREKSLQEIMLAASMGTPAEAVAVSLVSRLWLLIITVLPALIFLAYRRPTHEKDPTAG